MAKDNKPTEQSTTEYFYPEHGITVEATSQEAADKELANRLASLKELKAASADEETN